jgi:hypothetical protein
MLIHPHHSLNLFFSFSLLFVDADEMDESQRFTDPSKLLWSQNNNDSLMKRQSNFVCFSMLV